LPACAISVADPWRIIVHRASVARIAEEARSPALRAVAIPERVANAVPVAIDGRVALPEAVAPLRLPNRSRVEIRVALVAFSRELAIGRLESGLAQASAGTPGTHVAFPDTEVHARVASAFAGAVCAVEFFAADPAAAIRLA
jgi:hypothetical protein